MEKQRDAINEWPHAPEVERRNSHDRGFSKGWGMHFMPCEAHWADAHVHIGESEIERAKAVVDTYFSIAERLNLKTAALILPLFKYPGFAHQNYPAPEEMLSMLSALARDDRFSYMLYMDFRHPDAQLVRRAKALGAVGVKLHNAPVIVEGGDRYVWLSDAWRPVFEEIAAQNLPVLFHVTQRLSAAPYTGGGENTYWKQGWQKGVTYTNEDLLEDYLALVERYPGIRFLSAHQLHIGWDRLGQLFDRHPNLYADTTIGCFVREFDQIYEPDRQALCEIFTRYQDRLLFGTDIQLQADEKPENYEQMLRGHMRFVKQLRLADEPLQKLTHQNFERLFAR